jgi:hypothetical protein
MFRRDRCGRRGGGLCAYVPDDISCSVYQPNILSRNNDVEIMWLELKFHRESFFIALCYHSPRPVYQIETFVGQLSEGIDYINSRWTDCVTIVAGDLIVYAQIFLL